MASGKILVVDDDQNICELLRLYIEKEGFEVVIANDGRKALEMFEQENPDLIMLDIMLPELDGWQVCREIRKKSQCPIIMLTAKGEVFDKVLGLELGADDYIVKPFGIKELCARVRAVLRRTARSQEPEQKLEAGTLQVDIARHTVTKNGTKIELTAKEFDLLAMLMKNRGKVLTRDSLLDKVWGVEYFGDTRTVDVHVRYLRQKVEDDPDHPVLIQTVRGVGYRFSE